MMRMKCGWSRIKHELRLTYARRACMADIRVMQPGCALNSVARLLISDCIAHLLQT